MLFILQSCLKKVWIINHQMSLKLSAEKINDTVIEIERNDKSYQLYVHRLVMNFSLLGESQNQPPCLLSFDNRRFLYH